MNILELIKDCEVEWKSLGEVFDLRNGYTPSKSNAEYWENGEISWFRMEDIRTNGRVLNEAIQKVSKSAVKGGKLFPANSIMLSTTATIGEHALITIPYLSNQQLTNFSLKEEFSEKLNIKYAFYYFFLINEDLKNMGSDTSLPIVGIKKLEKSKSQSRP
nr:restriction endonuclease subunit S [Actinobacillus pleuropneumoniae]